MYLRNQKNVNLKRGVSVILLWVLLWLTACSGGGDVNISDVPHSASASSEPIESHDAALNSSSEDPLDAYFDRSVFVGDSVLEGIYRFVMLRRREGITVLGQSRFLTNLGGVSLATLVGDREPYIDFTYKGESCTLEEVLRGMNEEEPFNRIFLLLGLNDIARLDYQPEETLKRYSRLIDYLREAFPGREIILMTNPPKVSAIKVPDYTSNQEFNNGIITDFVTSVIDLCRQKRLAYVDINAALRDEEGFLPDEYCTDNFLHLSSTGGGVAVDALYDFAADTLGLEHRKTDLQEQESIEVSDKTG